MFSTEQARKENGATAGYIALAFILLIVGCVVKEMLSLETKLFALSSVWVALYYLQRVLVGKRRCSRHWFVKYGAKAAYYLPTPLAFYAASTLYYSTSHINDVTQCLVWNIFFLFVCTVFFSNQKGVFFTNMSAYSLGDDRPRDRCSFLMWLIMLGCLDWKWARLSAWNLLDVLALRGYLCSLAIVLLLYGKKPQESMDCQTKAVADYMTKKRKSSKSSSTSSPFFDANNGSLGCCIYPFLQHEGDGEWSTVKDLVQQKDPQNEDNNIIWLSYSLSRLLARRYYGFHCAEEGDGKVRSFALADLLEGTRVGRTRAFHIVEVQLAFLHDYFFTASLPNIELVLKHLPSVFIPLGFVSIIFTFFCAAILIPHGGMSVRNFQAFLVAVLCIYLSSYLYFWRLGQTTLLAFYWRPIQTAFHELKQRRAQSSDPKHPAQSSDPKHPAQSSDPEHPIQSSDPTYRPLDNIGQVTSHFFFFLLRQVKSHFWPHQHGFHSFQTQAGEAYWSKKLGQYSVLQDFNRHPSLEKELVHWFHIIMLSEPSYEFIKHLPVEEEELDMEKKTNLVDSIAELVANTLRAIDGPPTNGTMSLKENMGSGSYDLLWTCREETHTDTILIWHIATCYCDMLERYNLDSSELLAVKVEKEEHCHQVAMALSRYCAYLVAFLPEFLPEHSLTTKQVFQRVMQETQVALRTTTMEEKEKYTMMRLLSDQQEQLKQEPQTTFHKGLKLGRQLEMLSDDNIRWEVIAEFWAETILYIAPSDNAEAHIEHLAKGGEFITHLWAMLSNAGILKRAEGEWHPPPVVAATEEPPTHQLLEAMSSSNDGSSTSSGSSLLIQTLEPTTNGKGKQVVGGSR